MQLMFLLNVEARKLRLKIYKIPVMTNNLNNFENKTESIPMYKAGDPELVKKEIAELRALEKKGGWAKVK